MIVQETTDVEVRAASNKLLEKPAAEYAQEYLAYCENNFKSIK